MNCKDKDWKIRVSFHPWGLMYRTYIYLGAYIQNHFFVCILVDLLMKDLYLEFYSICSICCSIFVFFVYLTVSTQKMCSKVLSKLFLKNIALYFGPEWTPLRALVISFLMQILLFWVKLYLTIVTKSFSEFRRWNSWIFLIIVIFIARHRSPFASTTLTDVMLRYRCASTILTIVYWKKYLHCIFYDIEYLTSKWS